MNQTCHSQKKVPYNYAYSPFKPTYPYFTTLTTKHRPFIAFFHKQVYVIIIHNYTPSFYCIFSKTGLYHYSQLHTVLLVFFFINRLMLSLFTTTHRPFSAFFHKQVYVIIIHNYTPSFYCIFS